MKQLRKICPECGQKADIEKQYCRCGHQFYKDGEETSIPVYGRHFRGYLLTDIRSCVGRNYDLYIYKFTRVRQGKLSFNWSSALFSIQWMCYRKMWKYAAWFAAALVASTALTVLGGVMWVCSLSKAEFLSDSVNVPDFELIQSTIQLVFFIIFGLAADPLYWRTVKKKLDAQNCFQRPAVYDKETEERLRKTGGTLSVVQTIIMVILVSLCLWGIDVLITWAGIVRVAHYIKSLGL